MSLIDFPQEMYSALNMLLAAMVGALVGTITSRFNERLERRRLLVLKMERIYELCQMLCEGHGRELSNLKSNLPGDRERYRGKRQHPGREMSELKMLVRAYVPSVREHLDVMAKGHAALKEAFALVDEALSRDGDIAKPIAGTLAVSDAAVRELYSGSDGIKSGIEKALRTMTK